MPPAQPVDDTTFLNRLALLYPRPVVQTLTDELRRRREEGSASAAETLKAPFVKRMYDLSLFMKTLKQRLTQSYNRRHGRKGTLWESRFKSVLTGGEGAVATVAAYVDLNAVRAGLVDDPKDYRFCGYAEAVAGRGDAQAGLILALAPGQDWSAAADHYRTFVEEAFQCHRAFFSPKRATGARKLKHADGLYAARRLRLDLLGLPA